MKTSRAFSASLFILVLFFQWIAPIYAVDLDSLMGSDTKNTGKNKQKLPSNQGIRIGDLMGNKQPQLRDSSSLLGDVAQGRKDLAIAEHQSAQKKVFTLCSCFDSGGCKTTWSKNNSNKSTQFVNGEQQLLSKRKQTCLANKNNVVKESATLDDIRLATTELQTYHSELRRIDSDLKLLTNEQIAQAKAREQRQAQTRTTCVPNSDYPFAMDGIDANGVSSWINELNGVDCPPSGSVSESEPDQQPIEYAEEEQEPVYSGTSNEEFWSNIQSIQNNTMNNIYNNQMSAREARKALKQMEAKKRLENNHAASGYQNSQSNRETKSSKQRQNSSSDDCCFDVGLSSKTYGEALDRATAKAYKVCSRKGDRLKPIDLYHEQQRSSGWKFKVRLSYQCGLDP